MTYKLRATLIKVAVILAAGFLDFAVNYLFSIVLNVPLFLDTTFMIAVLFIYGPVESFFSYLVNVLCVTLRQYILYGGSEFVYLYSLSAITIILVTWFFGKYLRIKSPDLSVNKRFICIVLTATLAALVCSVVSGFINYFIYQNNLDDWAFNKIIFSFRLFAIQMNGKGCC